MKYPSNHRFRLSPCIAALFFLTISSSISNASNEDAEKELAESVGILKRLGMTIKEASTGFLARGASNYAVESRKFLKVEKGIMYVILAGGCKDAYDVNLGLLDRRTDRIFREDLSSDRSSELKFIANESTELQVLVEMTRSRDDGAHYSLVIGELPYESSGSGQGEESSPATVSTLDLDLEVDSANGRKTLRELMGTSDALYVRLWATWCPPCIELLPSLQYRQGILERYGVGVVAIENEAWRGGPGGNLQKAAITLRTHQVTLPVYVETREEPIFKALNVTGVPHSFVINKKGEILFSGHPLADNLTDAFEGLGISNFDLYGGHRTP